jgi:hypothetical protein
MKITNLDQIADSETNEISDCGDARIYLSLILLFLVAFATSCKEPYLPPKDLNTTTNYLVVDGILKLGADSTYISLSRTRGFYDSLPSVPELNAVVNVVGQFGETMPLYQLGNGLYASANLFLNQNEAYTLQISTTDGKQYQSDSLIARYCPPIDSVSWKQDSTSAESKQGVTIYVTTHDPSNNTRYYRWEYAETWQYRSAYFSDLLYDDNSNSLIVRDSSEMVYDCWRFHPSTDLQLASSSKLSSDFIFENPLVFIPVGDQRLGVEYSVLVKQYALSEDAYNYWQNLKKNTELTGSIFDPQPSQSVGNLHCISDPSLPVLGYISASEVQEMRLFISSRAINTWNYSNLTGCAPQLSTVPGPDSLYVFFHQQGYVPTTINGFPPRVFMAYNSCVDCTLQGGTNMKPSFWP